MTCHSTREELQARILELAGTARAARLARGISQQDLATAMGVSKSYLAHLEAGRRPITDKLLDRMRTALDDLFDPDQLVTFRIHVAAAAAEESPGIVIEIPACCLRDAVAAAAQFPQSAWTTGGGW